LPQSPTPGGSQQAFSSSNDSSQGNTDGMGSDRDGDRSDEEGGSNDRHDKMGGRGGGGKMQVSANYSPNIQHGTFVTLQLLPTYNQDNHAVTSAVPSTLRIRTSLMARVYQYLWFLAFYVTLLLFDSSTPSQIQDYMVLILTATVILTATSVSR
jgi:hypothetical protein